MSTKTLEIDFRHLGKIVVPCLGMLNILLVCSCGASAPQDSASSPAEATTGDVIDPQCRFPGAPRTVVEDGAAVVQVWELPDAAVLGRPVLPDDAGLLAYRAAIRADGADRRRPIADEPTPNTAEEAGIWRAERINGDLAHSGQVGAIEPIACLDALLFARQHRRVSQLDQPTEFLASVLRREVAGQARLLVIFGASDQMFPPKRVYGFDLVDEYRAQGWSYWYMLHNHTIQKRGDRLALGNPVLSTSDVQLVRNLAAGSGLASARVTNGFYTFTASASEFASLRARE